MDMESKIKAAVGYGKSSLSEVATKMEAPTRSTTGMMSVSNLSQKIKKGSLSIAELQQIAKAIGAELRCSFVFPDGTSI